MRGHTTNLLKKAVSFLILGLWSALVVFPFYTMIVNSLKPQRMIIRDPFGIGEGLNFASWGRTWKTGNFGQYYWNSLTITVITIALVLLFASLASFAFAKASRRTIQRLYVFFIIGIIFPIRLGTINIIQLETAIGGIDSIFGLIPIYIAMCLPMAILVLTAFIRALPDELLEAARVEGAQKGTIYRKIIVPLIPAALSTVAIFNVIPIWNDLWFPLILIRSESQKTVILGVAALFGQYQTDWSMVLSALSIAALPVLILYCLLSRFFIQGLTAGAVKG